MKPKYELENDSHAEIDPAGDPAIESDSDFSRADEDTPEDTSEEVSVEEEGTPDEEDAENPDEEVSEDGQENEVEGLTDLIPETVIPDPGAFEIGGVALKAGEKLTAQQVHAIKTEMERSYFRESDYTRKCQELAPIRDQANDVLTNFNQVVSNEFTNPALLFNHITPEHAIRALAAIGLDVDPNLLQQIGYGSSYRNHAPQNQGNHQNQGQNGDPEFRAWRQQQEQKEFTQKIDQEVRAEIADIKNADLSRMLYENILVQAALQPNKSIKQLAIEERQKVRSQFSKFFTAKKEKRKGTVVARSSGSSRAVQHKGPQTWDDADRSAMGRIRASRR